MVFAPALLAAFFAVEFSYPVELLLKRLGELFAGPGLMVWLARSAAPPAASSALVNGIAAAVVEVLLRTAFCDRARLRRPAGC